MSVEAGSLLHWVPWFIVAAVALYKGVGAIVVQYTESKKKNEIIFYYKERAMVAGIIGTMVIGLAVLLMLFYSVDGWSKWNILWLGALVLKASVYLGLMIAPFLRRIFFVLSDRWDWPD